MEAEKGQEAYAPCAPPGSTPGLSKLLYNYCIASILLTICIVGLASGGVHLLPVDPPLYKAIIQNEIINHSNIRDPLSKYPRSLHIHQFFNIFSALLKLVFKIQIR